MAATTIQIRDWWDPPCVGPWTKVALYGDGVVSVRGEAVEAVLALSTCLTAHKYPTRKDDTGAFNCRVITGGTGYSLHAYGVALDINWSTNPYGPTLISDMPAAMVDAILRLRTRNAAPVFRWGGNYAGNKDAMHFEIVCDPHDLATGIDPTTLPQLAPPPTPQPSQEDDDMWTYEYKDDKGGNHLVSVGKGVQISWTGQALLGECRKKDNHYVHEDAGNRAKFVVVYGPIS